MEGLNDLRNDLEIKREQLYAKLLEEMSKLLYMTSTADALTNFQRQGSTRGGNYNASPFQRTTLRRSTERAEANLKVKKALFEMTQSKINQERFKKLNKIIILIYFQNLMLIKLK